MDNDERLSEVAEKKKIWMTELPNFIKDINTIFCNGKYYCKFNETGSLLENAFKRPD